MSYATTAGNAAVEKLQWDTIVDILEWNEKNGATAKYEVVTSGV